MSVSVNVGGGVSMGGGVMSMGGVCMGKGASVSCMRYEWVEGRYEWHVSLGVSMSMDGGGGSEYVWRRDYG